MIKSKHAELLFDSGLSCSQAIVGAFAKELELPHSIAMKIASAFGGGIAGSGETCGAVTGALMVIGLKYGRVLPNDLKAKEKTYELSKELFQSFECKYKSLLCRELKLDDRSTKAKEQLAHLKCTDYVKDAVTIVEELFREYPVK
jgi:C_GCAxxG_C_C family probable redox protein